VHRILAYATYANARLVLCLRELGREAEADAALREARAGLLQNPWLGTIFRCLAGELTPEQLLAAADSTNPTQRCEGLFYAAEVARATGRTKEAERWFQQCADLGIRRDPGRPSEVMSETELAAWRLGRLP
jgi:hypothetical protein